MTVNAADFLEGFDSGSSAFRHQIQADPGKNPVFPQKRRDVTDRSQGDNVKEFPEIGIFGVFPKAFFAQRSAKRDQEIKGDAHASQALERKGAVLAVGIDAGDGRGELIGDFVVVQHDRVDARGFGVGDLFDIGDAAIHGDNQLYILLFELIDDRNLQPVAFLNPVRNVIGDAAGQLFDKFVQNDNGGDAVRVVVAVNDDVFFVVDRLQQTGHAFSHVLHQKGTVQVVEGRVQIALCAFQAVHVAI